MGPQDFKRKLTAVFSADVVGYSRLMGEDESATVKTLEAHKQVMFTLIRQHRGRVIDSPGDNLLAEFASVVDAVQCAVAVQKELKARNADLPEHRKMEFRIGINLGDVIEEQERIYGDGVNIAARLEALAPPGGICISKTAFDHIESKLPLGYEYLGELTVKNIARPVGAYRVVLEPRVTVAGVVERKASTWKSRVPLAIALIVILLAGAVASWQFFMNPSPPPVEKADPGKMALPLPDKPSIAVLPFLNKSGRPDQDYFADGMTDQIINSLSKIPRLFVISRDSMFFYKGKPVEVRKVAEEMGVRNVLEGTVQRSGDRMRILVQLIDAVKGGYLWSERYDGKVEDVFKLQDEIALKITTALQVKLTEGEFASGISGGTSNLKALECAWRAEEAYFRFGKEDNAAARRWSEEATKIDPNFAAAWAIVGWTHFRDVVFAWGNTPAQSMKMAEEYGQKSISLDPKCAKGLSLIGRVRNVQDKYDEAISYGEKAVAVNPNDPTMTVILAIIYHAAGRFDESIALIKGAMRICPYYPALYLQFLAPSYVLTGRYEEAIEIANLMLERSRKGEINPLYAHICLAEAYIGLDRVEKAKLHAEEVLKINPKFNPEKEKNLVAYKFAEHKERRLSSLRKAGLFDRQAQPLPDKPSIAVLPFFNMSGGPDQDLFCDGFTDQIITSLAKIPHLFIIASNSSFTYKGKPVKVQDVAKELGVRYVLEGSIQKAENKIRIRAQLIDALSGHHMWAENYDRNLEDVFAIQDEIAGKIITSLQVTLTSSEYARAVGKATKNLQALQYWWLAQAHYIKLKKEDNALAKQYAEKALELDPRFATAWAELGFTHLMDSISGWSSSREESMKLAEECSRKALSLNPSELKGLLLVCRIAMTRREYDKSLEYAEKAAKENPNDPYALNFVALSMMYAGRHVEAVASIRKAMRQTPHYPPHFLFNFYSSFLLRQYDDAIWAGKKMLEASRGGLLNERFGYLLLIAAHSEMGQEEKARQYASEFLNLQPSYTLELLKRGLTYKNSADLERFLNALRKAGIPE